MANKKRSKDPPVDVQAYGAGVQSRALLHMAINGLLPKPQVVIFADTQAEPEAIYKAVEEDKVHAENAGIRFDVVTYTSLFEPNLPNKSVFIPAYTLNDGANRKGMLRRACTDRFKIAPIRRHLRSININRVTMWLGISTDEADRMKESKLRWIENRYPLIEYGISRSDCSNYLNKLGLAAVKSACVFCPYRSDRGWKSIMKNPNDWAKAVEYDEKLRNKGPNGVQWFVHQARVPLRDIELSDNQIDLFSDECEGYCGL